MKRLIDLWTNISYCYFFEPNFADLFPTDLVVALELVEFAAIAFKVGKVEGLRLIVKNK